MEILQSFIAAPPLSETSTVIQPYPVLIRTATDVIIARGYYLCFREMDLGAQVLMQEYNQQEDHAFLDWQLRVAVSLYLLACSRAGRGQDPLKVDLGEKALMTALTPRPALTAQRSHRPQLKLAPPPATVPVALPAGAAPAREAHAGAASVLVGTQLTVTLAPITPVVLVITAMSLTLGNSLALVRTGFMTVWTLVNWMTLRMIMALSLTVRAVWSLTAMTKL